MIRKTSELTTLVQTAGDPIAYHAFVGLQIAHPDRKYTPHRIDTLEDFQRHKTRIQSSLSK